MAANGTFLFIGILVVFLVIFFFFFKKQPEVVVVQHMDPMACCPPCGRGVLFFDYMEDMLSGDARLYHEFMQLKGIWDCENPKSKPFIDKKTRAKLQSLVIPNRIRARLVDSGECLCMRIGLKDRRTYLETPDGERRYQVEDFTPTKCSLIDEHGRTVNVKLDIDVDDFIKLRDAFDQLQKLLQNFVRESFDE